MEEILRENGFVLNKDNQEWTRGAWTIRFDDISFEVYDDPEVSPHKVYNISRVKDVNLLHIIEIIDSLLETKK